MAITEKTRKTLWGPSGNRCAICRRELVIERTCADDQSVVGDECHIISGKGKGPRHDPSYPVERLDDPENLILLCRVHHKMVDDQWSTFSVGALRQLKSDHEKWVDSTLSAKREISPVRIRRIKGNIPNELARLRSGRELVQVLDQAAAFSFDHDDPRTEAEAELIGEFLGSAQDWGDISSDLDAGERVTAAYHMAQQLRQLEAAGYALYGATEQRRLEGGPGSPTPFVVAILAVTRSVTADHVAVQFTAERST